jgi:hypothetical protein
MDTAVGLSKQSNCVSKQVGEVNTIINVLGNYPFDEVNQIFAMVQQHVRPIEAEEKTEAEKPAK